ncbi:short-chain dehydrogenase reductase SDR [Pyrrhoderma noxium]|uniref:Short-chain dehydrogenase reductase SDR n=1 Tax=Pyrrhoderma noxium TaxID=2282107 RepID=A0A286U5A8_9AGAM|nr:short-chain dehydrogenase reductase SDR [Pyrrhoderma noxium]
MSTVSEKPIIIVAGVGNGSGTGAGTARVFANAGYRVALVARNEEHLKNTAAQINGAGGEASAFPVPAYDSASLSSVFASISTKWPGAPLRAALWNAGYGVWKPFLSVTDEELDASLNANVRAPFIFSRLAITAFKKNDLNEHGKRGVLLFTGATASTRGNTTTSAFSVGKFGLRSLSQSLNKEFGKENIHVAHAIIDGVIITDRVKQAYGKSEEWAANADVRLDPESIGKAYLYLANQDRSAWTWELDLRPAHEKW